MCSQTFEGDTEEETKKKLFKHLRGSYHESQYKIFAKEKLKSESRTLIAIGGAIGNRWVNSFFYFEAKIVVTTMVGQILGKKGDKSILAKLIYRASGSNRAKWDMIAHHVTTALHAQDVVSGTHVMSRA